MNKNIVHSMIASVALAAVILGATAQPAKADQAATTRLIAGAAAVAAIVTAINVEHKHQVANTVVGYLSDGSTVYEDGHIVSAQTGQSWYPGNYGEQVACSNNQCYITASNNGYGYYNGSNNGYGYNNGNGYYNGSNNGYGYGTTYQYQRRPGG